MLTINLPDNLRFETAGQIVPGVELRIDTSAAPEGTHVGAAGGGAGARARSFQGLLELAGEDGRGVHRRRLVSHRRPGLAGELRLAFGLAGRRSTMIVTAGGENVQPDTIEEAYQKHPAIEEIAVLERQGKIVGLIVPKIGVPASDDVEAAVRKAVADVSRDSCLPISGWPEFAVTREAIPRTRLGKPRRHLLAGTLRASDARRERGRPRAPRSDGAGGDVRRGSCAARGSGGAGRLGLAGRPLRRPPADPGQRSECRPRCRLDGVAEHLPRDRAAHRRRDYRRGDRAREYRSRSAGRGGGGRRSAGLAQAWIDNPESALSEDEKRWLRPLGPVSKSSFPGPLLDQLCADAHALPLALFGTGESCRAEGPYIIAPNHTSFLDPRGARGQPRSCACCDARIGRAGPGSSSRGRFVVPWHGWLRQCRSIRGAEPPPVSLWALPC